VCYRARMPAFEQQAARAEARGRASARRSPAAWAGQLALSAASLLVCAAGIEAGARLLVRRREARPQTQRSFLEYDARLGWRKAAAEEDTLYGEGTPVLFRINSHGLRGPEIPYAKPRGGTRVLLLGDSFTEAGTVEERASLAAVLERALRARHCPAEEVINGGTSGYSTDQEYLFLEGEGWRYEPDVVVLLFFSNDLQGNTSTRKKPWFELEDGRLVLRNVPVPAPPEGRRRRDPDPPSRLTPWHGSLALRLLGLRTERANPPLQRWLAGLGLVPPAADHAPTRDWLLAYGPDSALNARRWEVTLALLDALQASVARHGASLLVFYVPAGFELDARDWRRTRERWELDGEGWDPDRVARGLADACRARGLTFVDPRPALRQAMASGHRPYLETDPHWSAAGHEAAAAALLPYVTAARPCAGEARP